MVHVASGAAHRRLQLSDEAVDTQLGAAAGALTKARVVLLVRITFDRLR